MAKKKVSKKNAKDAFPDESTPVIAEPSPVIDEEEEDEAPSSAFALLGEDDDGGLMNMISRASKKKSKKPKPAAFESDDDKDLGALPVLGSDEEEDVFGQIVSKKGKKKNKVLSFGSLEGMDDEEEDDLNMAPSKKGKKKKTKKELPSFDALDEDVLDEPIEEVELLKEKKKSKKSKKEIPAFDALSADEPEEIDEPISPKKEKKKKGKNDDDLDALAALIEDASVQPSGKGKKNKKKKQVDEDLDALAALIEDNTVAAKPAGKGKKNKATQQVVPTDDSPLAPTDEIPEVVPEIKIKTAKQKEKERKERQKEEKRRLAAEQKAAEGSTQDTTSPTQDSVTLDDDTSSAKGKAKGKKGKGPSAAILALRKQQEALRAAEEEAARLIEEEKRKVEEEERRIAEQEKLAEEARLAKKQKDAEKREQLRKEGKLLTKSQKEAKRKAELRLIALKESGMIIPALSQTSENTDDSKPKARVFVTKRKSKFSKASSGSAETTPVLPEEKLPGPVEEVTEDDKKDDVKESWDASDDGIKDNWDDSDASEEEKEADMQPKEVTEKVKEEEKEDNKESEDSEEDSDSDDDSDESSEEELTAAQRMALQKKQEAAERRQKRIDAAMAARSKDDLRSPICCILGHVDTGKTKLLDKIRQTNVQEGEAGGITQQIGATYFPVENIIQKTAVLGDLGEEYKLPGVLVIDTPGHESFTNLRTRGSSLCNIAILVVDLMHGLEPQTLESIRLLRDRKTPFIVALNKIDRIYDWRATPDNGFQSSLAKQPKHVREEFDNRVTATITAFAEQGLNAKLYYENKNFAKYVSFVPTSAITGEGIPDLLHLLVTLTQSRLTDRLMYVSELECTVLEVKVIEGLGTTIDVVLSNGYLNEGDRIVVCGLNGPVVTQVRALLTPQPLRELRVKSAYVHHKRVKAALGIKISAPGLESVIAGSRLLVVGPDDDEEELKDAVMEDLQTLLKSIDRSGRGVSVQASTLGSLEALLEFLRVSKIPVSAINIGPVHKKDIIRASAMLEKAKEFAVMLAFDVEVDKDATLLAEQLGVRVFTADIIYHLFDKFTAYNKDIVEQRRKEQAPSAVFPCVLRMIPGAIFSRRDPIIFGADVVEGTLRLGTPICVVQFDPATKKRDIVNLGVVTGIENNHKPVELVKKGMAGAGVAVKIECPPSDTPKLFGRHFTEKDEFYSRITRKSIDVLKSSFREDLSKDEWALVVKLKKILDVI